MPLSVRTGLFLLLWFETARCFSLGADGAFLLSLFLTHATRFVAAFSIEVAGFEEEFTSLFIAWGLIWLAIYFWLAPRQLRDLPLSYIGCAVVGLGLLGRRAFLEFMRRPQLFGKPWLREHSEAVVGALLAALGCTVIAEHRWGSVLPLVGYATLLFIPFAFGWRLGARKDPRAYEARFGRREDFEGAGVSEDQ